MPLSELLFSFQGRIPRRVFWIWNLCYYLGILVVAMGVKAVIPGLAYLILPVFLLLILLPDLAITVKRWHDRDKIAWWLLLNVPLVIGRMTLPMDSSMATQPTIIETTLSFLALICGTWILIEYGFMKGTSGPNRFGPEPE